MLARLWLRGQKHYNRLAQVNSSKATRCITRHTLPTPDASRYVKCGLVDISVPGRVVCGEEPGEEGTCRDGGRCEPDSLARRGLSSKPLAHILPQDRPSALCKLFWGAHPGLVPNQRYCSEPRSVHRRFRNSASVFGGALAGGRHHPEGFRLNSLACGAAREGRQALSNLDSHKVRTSPPCKWEEDISSCRVLGFCSMTGGWRVWQWD
jgi:hypothetical protein